MAAVSGPGKADVKDAKVWMRVQIEPRKHDPATGKHTNLPSVDVKLEAEQGKVTTFDRYKDEPGPSRFKRENPSYKSPKPIKKTFWHAVFPVGIAVDDYGAEITVSMNGKSFKMFPVVFSGENTDFSLVGHWDAGHRHMATVRTKEVKTKDGKREEYRKIAVDARLFTEEDPVKFFTGDEEGQDDDFCD